MNKNREVILENPFHPLDLSPHDLLTIYKRFEQSRVVNRNPKQQLPIETIAQLISSLKGCPPSYIQKCISQALIKETMSWNQFLTFLDQESEVRQKILQWLMFQKTTIKYKFDRQWPIRSKLNCFFEEITSLRFIQLTQDDKLILVCIDNLTFFLLSETNGKLGIIDSFKNKSEKGHDEKGRQWIEEELHSREPTKTIKNDSKIGRKPQMNKSLSRSERKDKHDVERAINNVMNSAPKVSNLAVSVLQEQDEDTYFRKERKNINSLFGIWKELNLDHSITYAKVVAPKISQRNFNQTQISQLKELYSGFGDEKTHQKKIGSVPLGVKPLDKAMSLLKDLHRQKRVLSYNPYSAFKGRGSQIEIKPRKLNTKERKQRQYAHEANKQAYNDTLKCLAVMYYNMDLVLIKIMKEFNKISLEEQDKIKVMTENQHKKNEIIQAIDFYYHSIVAKWFLIVLVRVEYKNEFKAQSQSYIRGYQINLVDNKRRGGQDYRFASKKEVFTYQINENIKLAKQVKDFRNQGSQHGVEPGKQIKTMKNQIFKMQTQTQYGIHFITVGGKYICIKEDYQQGVESTSMAKIVNGGVKSEDIYFTFYHQQKFKNAGLSLSCLSVGRQLNKIVFGTIRGMIIIYDMFSHYFKIKKVSNSQIKSVKILNSLVYILTLDQKLIILDLLKLEEVQHVSVKNETKLHEKIKNFEIRKNVVYFYGTEMKSYSQFANEELQHQQRKMQTIYKWRLDKLFSNQGAYHVQKKIRPRDVKKYMPNNALGQNLISTIQIVLTSKSYFLILTDILELIILEKKSLKIKFTMILGIPHDSKVMKMALSPNQKLLALLLFNQNIVIFNIHTQEQYQNIKPSPYLKYTALSFLDLKNEYLLAIGTENGKIMLSPYNSIPEKNPKILECHKKIITLVSLVNIADKEVLVGCGEDEMVSIWILPFNILKYEIKVGANNGYAVQEIGLFKQYLYLRLLEGPIVEINLHSGKTVGTIEEVKNWIVAKVDSCTGQIMGVCKNNTLQIMSKVKDNWQKETKGRIEVGKSEVRELCLVDSERVLIFLQNGAVLTWIYQEQKFTKKCFNLCQQS